jgi:hemolysin activation/secretion protein
MQRAMVYLFIGFWGAGVFTSANAAPGEAWPEAELRRQQERQAQQRERLEGGKPHVRLSHDAKAPARLDELPTESPCFEITRLQLRDAESRSIHGFEWLQEQLAHDETGPLAGRCVGAQGVGWLIDHGQTWLAKRGYVTTRLLATPQDLSTGTLTLTLIPGRIRAIRFDEGAPSGNHFTNALPVEVGDLLNLRDIEQALENLKRVPTADADIQIAPAQGADAQIGDSDLVIVHRQASRVRWNLSLDDSGTKATGKLLTAATVSLDNALWANDLFYLTVNTDMGAGDPGPRGTHGKAVHYSWPVGYWTWGLTWNESRYAQQVAGLNAPYIYSGTSENTELKSTRLLYRDATQKLHASLTAFQRKSNNYVEDTEIWKQRRIEAGWIAGLQHKTFLGDATLESSLNYKVGTKDFGALPAPEDPSGWGTSQFKLTTADVSYALPFQSGSQRYRFNSVLRVQTYDTPLTPLNRFAIAGRYTVRGFDGENVLTGERGWLTRNELSAALADSGQEIYYALDHGEVGGPTSEWLVGKTLTGNAIGLRGGWRGVNYDIFLAAPVRKPDHFKVAPYVAGFSVNVSF